MPHEKSRSKKRILLVDDHPLLRQGISQLVNQQADLTVCGEAEDRAGALKAAAESQPDLAVVDVSLKNERGMELIKDLKVRFPGVLILVLSMHDESVYAERALHAGARGYIMKREASDKVLDAIRCVLDGGVYVSKSITGSILNKFTGGSENSRSAEFNALTDRELEVLGLVGKGFSAQQISERLHISIKTVEAHRANIKLKLNCSSGADLLQRAIRWTFQTGEI
ncbi:MAG: response regulator transcription factor [Verrucomicrobia bacterium]|nr:response regulator transcription factor [Verrucomicrobiota bacterium]